MAQSTVPVCFGLGTPPVPELDLPLGCGACPPLPAATPDWHIESNDASLVEQITSRLTHEDCFESCEINASPSCNAVERHLCRCRKGDRPSVELGRGLLQETFERKRRRSFRGPFFGKTGPASEFLPAQLSGRRPAAAAPTQPCPWRTHGISSALVCCQELLTACPRAWVATRSATSRWKPPAVKSGSVTDISTTQPKLS